MNEPQNAPQGTPEPQHTTGGQQQANTPQNAPECTTSEQWESNVPPLTPAPEPQRGTDGQQQANTPQNAPEGTTSEQWESNVPPLTPAPEPQQDEQPSEPEFYKGYGLSAVDVSQWEFDFTQPYQAPQNTLSIGGGTGFAPLGELCGISGFSGNGKSWLVCQLIIAVLRGMYGFLRYELSNIIPHPKVLLIDTEMAKWDISAIKMRVLTACGRDTQQVWEQFKILSLRDCISAEERWKIILKAISEYKPHAIFIDGMLDIVEDFNSQTESAERLRELMAITSFYHCVIWAVCHQNPANANQYSKMSGHLGSVFLRKASILLRVVKKDEGGKVHFEVEADKFRGRDFELWKFRIDNSECEFGEVEFISPNEVQPIAGEIDDVNQMCAWLIGAQMELPQPCTKNEVKELLRRYGNVKSNDRLTRDVEALVNRRILREQPRDEWEVGQKYPKYYFHPEF